MLNAFEAEMLALLPFVYWMKIMQAHNEFLEDLLS